MAPGGGTTPPLSWIRSNNVFDGPGASCGILYVGLVETVSHAVIAGTGRAGTSFLVDFLRAVGVPTDGLGDQVENLRARAGLERHLDTDTASYLIKDPWLFEYLDDVDFNLITIDALIVPVRGLTSAAMSRVRLERAALIEEAPRSAGWSSFGRTPGGVVYSLTVSDQEKVLALGQARLLDWALTHDLPLFLLNYPRLVTDAEYVVDTLWPWLQRFSDRESALAAFRERSDPRRWESDDARELDVVSRDDHLDVVAQKEALELLLGERTAEKDRSCQEILELEQSAAQSMSTIVNLERRLEEQETKSANRIDELNARLLGASAELAGLALENESTQHANAALQAELLATKRSRSYRIGSLLSAPWRRGVRRAFGIKS